nr:hypothetical protein [Tanacetum cinerariifolium]
MKDSDAYKTYYDFTIGKKYSDKDDDDDQDGDNVDDEDDDDQDDNIEHIKSDNDDDDFVHPKLSTFDEEERHEEKLDEEEEGYDQRTHTPSHLESTDDEAYNEVTQRDNVGEEKLDEENTIDSILNLNIESTSLVDVPVTTNDEIAPLSITTLPPPPIPLIQNVQQTSITTPTIAPSTSLQNLPTFGSLFKFEDRIKSLEDDFLEFKQTNLFVEAVSSIPGTVDKYLANQMDETIKAVVQLQSDRLRDEAKAENEDFVNKIDENIKKIIKEQDKTSKSTESSKERPKSKTRSTDKSAQADEQVYMIKDLEEPAPQEFKTGLTEDYLIDETTQLPDWFQKSSKPPTFDCDWNKTLPVVHGPIQPLTSTLAQKEYPRESFNELIDTPLYFSAFMMNRLKVDTLTPELLTDLTFELMIGSCKSRVELEYFLEEVYKANMDQLDSNNPKG